MNKRLKTAVAVILSVALVIGVLAILQRLLVPKYVDGIVEGAFVKEYYSEEMDHDVIFIGDCEVYENFSPAVLWKNYGINSYIRGSAEQYIFQSYYLLEDTFLCEKPKVVMALSSLSSLALTISGRGSPYFFFALSQVILISCS